MNKDVEIEPEAVQPRKVNYFTANHPHQCHPDIPVYKAVLYPNAYPGIDKKLCRNNGDTKDSTPKARWFFTVAGQASVH